VGVARVAKEACADPTATEGDWVCVDLVPIEALKKPVGLETIKADRLLRDLPLVKHGRLSVSPLSQAQFERVLELAKVD
jgi:predicted RNA-binding protein with PUA-like domain